MSEAGPRVFVHITTLDDPIHVDTWRIRAALRELGLRISDVGIDWATDDEWRDLHHHPKRGRHAKTP